MKIFLSIIRAASVLGKGKFAEVKRAIDKKTKEPFAVKVITKDKVKSGDQSKLKTEIDIMKKVSHPNCVSFTEVYESRTKLYIIMELVTGGELFDRIIEKEHYSEKEAAGCFQQVCRWRVFRVVDFSFFPQAGPDLPNLLRITGH